MIRKGACGSRQAGNIYFLEQRGSDGTQRDAGSDYEDV